MAPDYQKHLAESISISRDSHFQRGAGFYTGWMMGDGSIKGGIS
jgi:hypothetical protein